MTAAAQQSLNNFYQSVKFSYPLLADLMKENIEQVALNGLCADSTPGQEYADRLRRQADRLPELHRRVLANALIELGYS
jgi:hypothetical protein